MQSAGDVAIERVSGELHGRSGTFVLIEDGKHSYEFEYTLDGAV